MQLVPGEAVANLDDVAYIVRLNKRVCPRPLMWDKLYHLLPNRRRIGVRSEPPVPLILSSWWVTSDNEKRDRLRVHVEWAERYGALAPVLAWLAALPESEWHHQGE